MAPLIKVLEAKVDNLGRIPETHMEKKRSDFCKLS